MFVPENTSRGGTFLPVTTVTSGPKQQTRRFPLRETTSHVSRWTNNSIVTAKHAMRREVNQPQHWLNYVTFCFVNRLNLDAAIAWGLSSHRAWSYAATSSLLFPVELKMDGKTIFMSSSKVIRLMLLVVSPKKFLSTIIQSFFNITEQHWFPTKSGIDNFSISVSLLLPLSMSVDLGTSNTSNVFFFQSNFLTPNSLFGNRHFHFVPQCTVRSDEAPCLISAHGGLSTANSAWQLNCS